MKLSVKKNLNFRKPNGYISSYEMMIQQVKNPREYPEYKETFSTNPFMCLDYIKERKNPR